MIITYTSLLLMFLEFIHTNHAIICDTEEFHIRSLRGTCTDQIVSLKDNCPLDLQRSYNCRGKNVKSISEIEGNTSYCSLDISRNSVKRLKNGTFREWTNLVALDHSDNYDMEKIESDAFQGLPNLRYLNLKHTGIHAIPYNYRFFEGFRHLPELIILDLTQNNFKSYDSIRIAVNHTRKLQYLALEGCPSCTFGPEFGTLKQLITLDQTVEKEWSYCFIETLNNKYFENLQFLKYIFLSDC
ncbi:hypothetical protein CHS0354_000861 [Potamilus streckersoni]|uniref:Uncharacterized protein n=1 Tax=Potamilus streckersoni TaxID=2493646 RepID=A0AAE0T629_9BIVA|nr:hypothetical protein CHS0354_000861 [Potamilus streckersoni]